jgi:hypothetical protein
MRLRLNWIYGRATVAFMSKSEKNAWGPSAHIASTQGQEPLFQQIGQTYRSALRTIAVNNA